MNYSSPSTIPFSSDPAIFLHSEIDNASATDQELLDDLPQYNNHSDELEALQLQDEEVTAEKNRRGLVIQHRAWRLAEAFRSDELYNTESPSKKRPKVRHEDESISFPHIPQIVSSTLPGTTTTMVLGLPAVMHSLGPSPPVVTKTSKPSFFDSFKGKKGLTRGISSFGASVSDVENSNAATDKSWPLVPDESKGRQKTSTSRIGSFMVDGDGPDYNTGLPICREATKHKDFSSSSTSTGRASNETQGRSFLQFTLTTKSLGAKRRNYSIKTCSGKNLAVSTKSATNFFPCEQLVAAKSTTAAGRAQKSYYGIDIHELLDGHAKETKIFNEQTARRQAEIPQPSIEPVEAPRPKSRGKTLLWTEKYRAKTFTDLIGDERTHRSVLRWLKSWDPIVFPRQGRTKATTKGSKDDDENQRHRKILLLTGQAGLGKTTLAHVAAKQAGYEVIEINGSDERSAKFVQERIRDSLGTENIKGLGGKFTNGKVKKAGRPVCLVVDEVDGAVAGSAGGPGGVGEGGFIKALMDLVVLDQKNSSTMSGASTSITARRKKKNDKFRILRPIILICNDVYHPSLRPLRQSGDAEIIHIRKPPLNMVVSRMKTIFEKEGYPCDGDGVRRLCEATWGLSSGKDAGSGSTGSGEGDIRGIMVVGEWVAGKLRCSPSGTARLTRRWVETHVLGDLNDGGTVARGLGRGSNREIVERVFLEGAGFPKTSTLEPTEGAKGEDGTGIGVTEIRKRMAMDRLREMVESGGECDRVITDCFSEYLSQPYQDDTLLSKLNAAYEWLHFHDTLNSRVFQDQEWELTPYLSQPVLSFHHLFASSTRHSRTANPSSTKFGEKDTAPSPFTGPKADFTAYEAEKLNRALLLSVQSALSMHLLRSFRSPEQIATDLVPYLNRMLTPDIKPVVVRGSGDQRGVASVRKDNERSMVRRAVRIMSGVGVTFERGRTEEIGGQGGGWIYRMEPPIDVLATCETANKSLAAAAPPIRYAVRQVLDQEYQKDIIRQRNEAAQARYRAGGPENRAIGPNMNEKENMASNNAKSKVTGTKRDFFGRVIVNDVRPGSSGGEFDEQDSRKRRKASDIERENNIWVSFHEGFSNAVRKPITLEEFMRGL